MVSSLGLRSTVLPIRVVYGLGTYHHYHQMKWVDGGNQYVIAVQLSKECNDGNTISL